MTEETAEVRESTPEEIEAAKAQGWKDDPEHPNYKEAWKFVEDGQKIAPIQTERNHKLTEEIISLKQTMEEMRADFFKQRLEGQKEGYERAKKELAKRKQQAYEDEDIEELKRIEREEKDLAPPKVEEPAKPKAPNVDFLEWRERNAWYGDQNDPENMEMSLYADSIGELVARQFPEGTPLAKVYAEIEKKVKKRFPEKFGTTTKPNAAAVEGAESRPAKKTGKKDWQSLPKEIKEEAKNNGYVQRYFNGDKELYAKSYYSTLGQEA